ncbi:MAG: hypothetical protein JSS86_12150 [Cyanobacteria bacterium SZAS LIN-2]|nr:hypothetical protein [Cyanobacteria bacterium SZAS LIN-3]MBS1997062.1 hypothetical protein [Cyanobacteria bacterium SZAS LIN-2]
MVDIATQQLQPEVAAATDGENVLRMLDNPAKASEQMADLYRQLRNDPVAFRKELQGAQALSARDGNPANDLEIVYDGNGAVSDVAIKRNWGRDRNIFDRTSVDQYLKVEEFQKVNPERARQLVEPLLVNDGDGLSALLTAIDGAEGKADGTITRAKLEAFLLKEPKPGDDSANLYNQQNRDVVRQVLTDWDGDEFKHIRGLENTNAGTIWTPNYVQSESLSLSRLSQIFGKQGEDLFQSFSRKAGASVSDEELEREIVAEKTPAQKVADFYAEKHEPQEIANFERAMVDKAREGALYLAQHPEFMAKLTKEVPLVPGSSHTITYFDRDKIDSYTSESLPEMAVIEGLKASDVYLAQYGKRHSYDPLAATSIGSRPVDELVKMAYYFTDSRIKSMDDLRNFSTQ